MIPEERFRFPNMNLSISQSGKSTRTRSRVAYEFCNGRLCASIRRLDYSSLRSISHQSVVGSISVPLQCTQTGGFAVTILMSVQQVAVNGTSVIRPTPNSLGDNTLGSGTLQRPYKSSSSPTGVTQAMVESKDVYGQRPISYQIVGL